MNSIIAEIKKNLQVGNSNVEALLLSMDHSRKAAEEINNLGNDVKNLIFTQAGSVNEVTAIIEEINRTISNQDERINSQTSRVGQSSEAVETMLVNIRSIGESLNKSSREFDDLQHIVYTGSE